MVIVEQFVSPLVHQVKRILEQGEETLQRSCDVLLHKLALHMKSKKFKSRRGSLFTAVTATSPHSSYSMSLSSLNFDIKDSREAKKADLSNILKSRQTDTHMCPDGLLQSTQQMLEVRQCMDLSAIQHHPITQSFTTVQYPLKKQKYLN